MKLYTLITTLSIIINMFALSTKLILLKIILLLSLYIWSYQDMNHPTPVITDI